MPFKKTRPLRSRAQSTRKALLTAFKQYSSCYVQAISLEVVKHGSRHRWLRMSRRASPLNSNYSIAPIVHTEQLQKSVPMPQKYFPSAQDHAPYTIRSCHTTCHLLKDRALQSCIFSSSNQQIYTARSRLAPQTSNYSPCKEAYQSRSESIKPIHTLR